MDRSEFVLPMKFINLEGVENAWQQIYEILQNDANKHIDLSIAPLFRMKVIRIAEDEHVL